MNRRSVLALLFAIPAAIVAAFVLGTPAQQMLLAGGGADLAYIWVTTDGSFVSASCTTPAPITTFGTNGGRISYTQNGSTCINFQYARTGTALSGKTYAEFKFARGASGAEIVCLGVTEVASMSNVACFGTSSPNASFIRPGTGAGCGAGTAGYTTGLTSTNNASYAATNNDNIGIAIDASSRKIWYRKNGTWISGDPAADTSPTTTVPGSGAIYFSGTVYCVLGGSGSGTVDIMPSSGDLSYSVPSGYSPYKP